MLFIIDQYYLVIAFLISLGWQILYVMMMMATSQRKTNDLSVIASSSLHPSLSLIKVSFELRRPRFLRFVRFVSVLFFCLLVGPFTSSLAENTCSFDQ